MTARSAAKAAAASVISLVNDDDRNTQSSHAARLILRRVARLELPPGSTFSERELAAEIDMGKMPVREALHQLHHTGLVEARSGSGYVVAPITMRGARSLFEFWHTIVPRAAELVALRANPDDLDKVLDAIDVLGAAAANGTERDLDTVAFEVLVHQIIAGVSGNAHLMTATIHSSTEFERLLRFAISLGQPLGDVLGDTAAITDALRARDASAARNAISEHLAKLERAVLDALLTSDPMQDLNLAR